MKALLLVAHGSRRAESNAEVGRLAVVSDPQGATFGIIELLNPPD